MKDLIWQFINNNIEWIMSGGVLFIGGTLIFGWIRFIDILTKPNKPKRNERPNRKRNETGLY